MEEEEEEEKRKEAQVEEEKSKRNAGGRRNMAAGAYRGMFPKIKKLWYEIIISGVVNLLNTTVVVEASLPPEIWIGYSAIPRRGDLRLLGPPSGQGAGSGARTRDRGVPADLRADSQTTVPPKPFVSF
ncbi:hypothetical protein PoB_006524300 [Plakobranchus ocellatus]|uniref:Uncharacterized protein n=1 Tax=Plakobranchus ocellatus TaxID=259542 RepID=A0AAV4D3Y1_9GAST|nr:hypothetical protein PoB_006524300 [Plakobranchus ocellatus]